ncbi:MAG: carbamate kinase [Gammaproteobacteria bacterium]|nr:carbamate kinase [Gammaproteobacteria bacterium]NNJ97639.1 carbamate kinase [Gammaproteobacteria bacterium]
MRIVIALGGNALLRRDEALTAENQRKNISIAAKALAPIARQHDLIISHGNGPQVGLLALQGMAYKASEVYPLDILDAETEGMIGYLIEQELANLLPVERPCATLLTQIEVDPKDPAFAQPTKPIGPFYSETEANQLARERGWSIARDGEHFRRIVASPRPKRIFELGVIELLVNQGVIVICAGGGGIPTVQLEDGRLIGVEAVIDKDLASSLLARQLKADIFLMLTDVDAIYDAWLEPEARAFRRVSPQAISEYVFATGSMAPKVEAACEFVEQTGGIAGIGQLKDTSRIMTGEAGTVIAPNMDGIRWWP